MLWLARQLHLEVAEVQVQVQAVKRPDSKVQMVADALEMVGEVWAVRQAGDPPGFARWDRP